MSFTKHITLKVYLLFLILFFFTAKFSYADSLFIHNYKSEEFAIGSKEEKLSIYYTGYNKYIDKRTKLTSSFMKKWFGGEKELRQTTHILLDEDTISEIDYEKNSILVFPLSKIKDPHFYKRSPSKIPKESLKIIEKRYEVLAPQIKITTSPKKVKIEGYLCDYITINIKLETIDKLKKASSVTLIKQELWLTDNIYGITDYQNFNEKMGERLGINALYFGVLENLMSYMKKDMKAVEKYADKLNGYPVKKNLEVVAVYTKNIGSSNPKIIKQNISKISNILTKVTTNSDEIDKDYFFPSDDFKRVVVKD